MSFGDKSEESSSSTHSTQDPTWNYGNSGQLADSFLSQGQSFMDQGQSQNSQIGQNTMQGLAQNNFDWSVNPQLQAALDANKAQSQNQLGQDLNMARSQFYRGPQGRAAMGLDNAVNENNLGRNQYDTNAILGQYNQDASRMGTAAGNLMTQDNAEMARYMQLLNMMRGQEGTSTSQSETTSSDPWGTATGLIGGAGGMASGLGAMGFSDRRVKKNIVRLGEITKGLFLYSFQYLWESAGEHIGVMAQELEKLHPEAVGNVGSIKNVDYNQVESHYAPRILTILSRKEDK